MTVREDAQVSLSLSQLTIANQWPLAFHSVSKLASIRQRTVGETGGGRKGGTLSQSWTQREREIGCEIDGERKEKEASGVSISLDFTRIAP